MYLLSASVSQCPPQTVYRVLPIVFCEQQSCTDSNLKQCSPFRFTNNGHMLFITLFITLVTLFLLNNDNNGNLKSAYPVAQSAEQAYIHNVHHFHHHHWQPTLCVCVCVCVCARVFTCLSVGWGGGGRNKCPGAPLSMFHGEQMSRRAFV